MTLLQPLDRFLQSMQIAMPPPDRKSAQRAQQPGEGRRNAEKLFLGEVTERPTQLRPQKDGIKVALMVGDDQGAAMRWDVLQSKDFQLEHRRGENACHDLQKLPKQHVLGVEVGAVR